MTTKLGRLGIKPVKPPATPNGHLLPQAARCSILRAEQEPLPSPVHVLLALRNYNRSRISPAPLEVARGEAEKEEQGNVKFVEGDIADLISGWAKKKGLREGMFDAITCASIFVLIKDQQGL